MKSKQPLIALVPDYDKGSDNSYSLFPHYVIRSNYTDMIKEAGGIAIILPYDHDMIDYYLNLIDGLMIVGGDFDISPERYSEDKIHPKTKPNKVRENFEHKLTSDALKRGDLPIFGICNGMQLINVLQKGTIIQHIPDDNAGFINHEQRFDPNISGSNQTYHQVNVEKDSKFFDIVKQEKFDTNSTHHQGVKDVGKDMKVSARADDGMIEAIEHKNHPFCLGVQWHPEYALEKADKKLFSAFIKACKNYKEQSGK